MNEVSECPVINCFAFDNLYLHQEDVNFEILVPKATVRKLSLSSIVVLYALSAC